MGSMDIHGMGWMAGAMGLTGFLVVMVLVLLIGALVKTLASGHRDNHDQ